MFEFIANYIATPLSAILGVVGLSYIINPEGTRDYITNKVWEATKIYIRVSDAISDIGDSIETFFSGEDDNMDGYEAESDVSDSEDERYNLLFLDKYKNCCAIDISTTENIDEILDNQANEPEILILETKKADKLIHKRIGKRLNWDDETKPDINCMENPFIQVEYVDGTGETLAIHKRLDGFCVEGNVLFDRSFMELFLRLFYDRTCSDKYTVVIFDNNVNRLEIQENECIQITRLDDKAYTKLNSDEAVDKMNSYESECKNYEPQSKFSDGETDGTDDSSNETVSNIAKKED